MRLSGGILVEFLKEPQLEGRPGGPCPARSPRSRLLRRFREEWFDDFFKVVAVAFRTMNFCCFVLFHSQHFAELMTAFPADILIYWHGK
jgi:hypothetical protein